MRHINRIKSKKPFGGAFSDLCAKCDMGGYHRNKCSCCGHKLPKKCRVKKKQDYYVDSLEDK